MNPADPIALIAVALGLDPTTVAALIPLAVLGFNLLGRYIPDDKVGALGFVRKVSKFLGLYLSNRVQSPPAPGESAISVNDIAKAAAETPQIKKGL